MRNLTIDSIVAVTGGELVNAGKGSSEEAAGVVIDSRKVEPGYIFIATKGNRVDGHDYIDQVFQKGALAVVCEKVPQNPAGPVIRVNDSFKALTAIATYYRQQLSCRIVGITGSVGKTSTKEFIAGVLEQHYKVLKTEGNFNNEIGVPLTILRISEDTEVAVVEMGINHFGEMTGLTEIVHPDIAVITNIGTCHLEFLGDRDGVLRAKTEIFAGLNEGGRVVINGDDDKLATINEVKGIKPVKFGLDKDGNDLNWYADNIVSKGLLGSSCHIVNADNSFEAFVPLPGRHMVYNALAASAVATILNMTSDEIARGIESVKAMSGRSNIIESAGNIIIDDCYNANPVSVRAAIDLLTLADNRKVAVLGDMFELGSEEAILHRKVGEYAAGRVDTLVCIGALSKNTYEGAAGVDAYHYDSVEDALKELPSIVGSGSSVLVKASHSMGFDRIVAALTENNK